MPPELDAGALARVNAVLIARGASDEWYTASKRASDESRLREAGVEVQAVQHDAGHEWNAAVSAAVGGFLAKVRSSAR